MIKVFGNEEKFGTLINRITEIVSKNFQVGFHLLTQDEWLNLSVNRLLSDKDIYLPLKYRDSVLGVAQVTNGKSLSADQVSQLSVLVDSIFCGALAMASQADELEQAESRMIETHTTPETNVISLSDFSHRRETPAKAEVIEKNEPSRPDLTIFISAKSNDQIFRIAHEVYSKTNKYAFLEISTFKENEITPEFLNSLNNICLFIRDVSVLSKPQATMIENYLSKKDPHSNDGVLIISGSTKAGAELVNSGFINLDLYRLLSQIRLSHSEESITQEQLEVYSDSVVKAQQDIVLMSLLNQLGFTTLTVDNRT